VTFISDRSPFSNYLFSYLRCELSFVQVTITLTSEKFVEIHMRR